MSSPIAESRRRRRGPTVQPSPRYDEIAGYWAFYAQLLDECWIDDERVDPNPGSFYGGWITANVTGPFKGGPGTSNW